jgi:acyl-coenzyme A thioesterase PaaI-like protein
VHGGIQAVLLDEVMGTTARIHAPTETTVTVTAEMQLKYRRPVPIAEPLLIRGRLLRAEGRDFFITAEILDGDDQVLTAAEARFRALGEMPSPR